MRVYASPYCTLLCCLPRAAHEARSCLKGITETINVGGKGGGGDARRSGGTGREAEVGMYCMREE